MDNREHLANERNELRYILAMLPEMLNGEPPEWFNHVARGLVRLRRHQEGLSPHIREYLGQIVGYTLEQLHQEAADGAQTDPNDITDEYIGHRAHARMVAISQQASESFRAEMQPVTEHVVSIKELVAARPDLLDARVIRAKGTRFMTIGIRHPETGAYHRVKLPNDDDSFHKGGIARVLLKIYAGAPVETILSELPLNDVDFYVVGETPESRRMAKLIGADEQGIEVAKGDRFDFVQYANGRDMTFNQVCLGRDGLHFSDEAYEAARTGHIDLVGHYIPDRAIYGFDRYPVTLNGIPYVLAKPRGMMRYVKALAENKASSFDYLPVNQNLDFGIYWLVLARKWAKTPKFAERMQRMFHVCQQMGQVREGEQDVMDVLTRVHREYPYFNLEHEFEGEVGVARWIAGKLIKQLDREFGWTYSIPSGLEFRRQTGDTQVRRIDMQGFCPDSEQARRIEQGWDGFVVACRQRLHDYLSLGISYAEKYFIDADPRGMPPEFMEDMM